MRRALGRCRRRRSENKRRTAIAFAIGEADSALHLQPPIDFARARSACVT